MATALLNAFGARSWSSGGATSFGRLPMHSTLPRERTLHLDGTWSFRLRKRPEDVTAADVSGPTSRSGWSSAEVPGCWTMQGFDRPQYTNVVMPFEGPPPRVPDANPTGVYRTPVALPETWAGDRVVLRVAGAESVLYVFVDGAPVGMGKDSRLPHEFDLTEFVNPVHPFDLGLAVVRWSDATYLEDQDHWYHAGLHRSVLLYATPPIHIADVHATADFDPAEHAGRLSLRVAVGGPAALPGPGNWTIRAELDETSVSAPARFAHPDNAFVNVAMFDGPGARLELDLPGIEPWTAETPHLHDLTISLLDESRAEVDRVSVAVGFRRVEVRGADLLVNGRRVLVKGVNRHDHDMARGKAVTPESIEADIVAMKRHNFNAVRTSHYPADDHLYDACDRLGMYVIDEANVESHAYLHSLSKDPAWTGAIFERIVRMALRDKNHASVVMWSLGNESGVAPVHHAAAAWLRSFDPSRPLHYEGGISEDELGLLGAGTIPDLAQLYARARAESDVIAPMYPPVEALVDWATTCEPDRPLIMCEYCHAMGNSCGGLADYWEAIRSHPGLQGGFIWDWADQALVQVLPDGTRRLAYGGDFGDVPNDGAFCMDGLVATDRTPHPALLEAAAVLQPVQITAINAARGIVRLTNEHGFVGLSWLRLDWQASIDGLVVAAGSLEPPRLGPGETASLAIPVPEIEVGPGEQAHLDIEMRTMGDLDWAPAGHVVARAQLAVAVSAGISRAPGSPGAGGPATGRPAPDAPDLPDPDALRFDLLEAPGFDRLDARPDLERLEPALALWRAPIDNEYFGPRHADRWDRLGLRLPTAAARLETSTRREEGALVVTHSVQIDEALDDIARVGIRLHAGPGIESIDWLGVGPHECYSDRRASGRFGRYLTGVDDWPVRYVRPQASGNRVGVRWLRLLDAAGQPVLTIDELAGLDVTVCRWTDEQLAAATHLEELPPSGDCYVWIDARHRGVGSGACGPDTAPAHRVGPGRYRWSYRLS